MKGRFAQTDTRELFREYLERGCTEAELTEWVMRQIDGSDFAVRRPTRGIIEEAVGYLARGELVEQVLLNEDDPGGNDGYRQWRQDAVEEVEERRVREGVGYR